MCSLIGASSAARLLNRLTLVDPSYLERIWQEFGIVLIILLSTPMVWLIYGFLTLQAVLLVIAWLSDYVAAKVILTFIISFIFIINVTLLVLIQGPYDAFYSFLGFSGGANHCTLILSEGVQGLSCSVIMICLKIIFQKD